MTFSLFKCWRSAEESDMFNSIQFLQMATMCHLKYRCLLSLPSTMKEIQSKIALDAVIVIS